MNCRIGYYLTSSKTCRIIPDNCLNANQFGHQIIIYVIEWLIIVQIIMILVYVIDA
jgi:hypothetical protein